MEIELIAKVAAFSVVGFLVLTGIVYGITGWSWLSWRLTPEERIVVDFVKGARAMAPEGWENNKHGDWCLVAGDACVRTWGSDPAKIELRIDDKPIPMPRRRDNIRLWRIRGSCEQAKTELREKQERLNAADRIAAQLSKHRAAFDKLDRRIVAQRQQSTPSQEG